MTSYRMTVRNAPPGLLMLRDGTILFKTEYDKEQPKGELQPDVYVALSGERYHGEGFDVDCIDVTRECEEAAKGRWEAP